MIMGAREHTFSLLWQALFPTFLWILFFFLFGQLLYYMGLIQYRKRICMFSTEQHTRARARSQYHRIIFEVALFLKWKENSVKDDQSAHSIGRIKQVIFIFIKVVSTQQMCTNHAHTKILFQRRNKKRERERKSRNGSGVSETITYIRPSNNTANNDHRRQKQQQTDDNNRMKNLCWQLRFRVQHLFFFPIELEWHKICAS